MAQKTLWKPDEPSLERWCQEESNIYYCPQNHQLTPIGVIFQLQHWILLFFHSECIYLNELHPNKKQKYKSQIFVASKSSFWPWGWPWEIGARQSLRQDRGAVWDIGWCLSEFWARYRFEQSRGCCKTKVGAKQRLVQDRGRCETGDTEDWCRWVEVKRFSR